MFFLKVLTFGSDQKSIITNTENFYVCKKADIILLQYTFYQYQYFITPCLCMVEVYQEIFQSNSFNRNDMMVLFNWGGDVWSINFPW